jgi:hypothetical protein
VEESAVTLTLTEQLRAVPSKSQYAETLSNTGIGSYSAIFTLPDEGPRWISAVRYLGPASRFEFLRRLERIASLTANWDSYGAFPLSQHVITRVRDFVDTLIEQGVPLPHVAPSSSGAIVVEWRDGERVVEFEFDPSGDDSVSLDWDGESVEYDGKLEFLPFASRLSLERALTELAERVPD